MIIVKEKQLPINLEFANKKYSSVKEAPLCWKMNEESLNNEDFITILHKASHEEKSDAFVPEITGSFIE